MFADMKQTKEEAEKTRQLLLDTALDVFLSQGYSQTSLEQIARQSGLTRGAAYWHFPKGKPELYNSLVREKSLLAGERILQTIASDGTPIEQLRTFIQGWCDALEQDKEYCQVMQLVAFMTERVPELEGGIQEKIAANRQMMDYFNTLLRQGIKSGEVHRNTDTAATALMLFCQLWGMAEIWLMDKSAFSISRSMKTTLPLLLAGLLTTR